MRSVILILNVVAVLNALSAQNDRNPDPKATTILENLESTMHTLEDVTYLFELQISQPEMESQTKSGTFYTKGAKYRLELDNYLFITDATSQWVVDQDAQEIQIHDYVAQGDDLTNPQNLLAIYNNPAYDYRLLFEGAQGENLIQQIEFKPLDRTSEYSKAKLTIDKRTGYITDIEVFVKDGSRYNLKIKETNPNTGLALNLFHVEKEQFPSFQTEDLRLN